MPEHFLFFYGFFFSTTSFNLLVENLFFNSSVSTFFKVNSCEQTDNIFFPVLKDEVRLVSLQDYF